MDCEKLDEMAMDLVDPEGGDGIDARAAREAEEHLAGCARCTAVIERLRGGMRAGAELGLDDPSSLLEARILAAAGAVQPDVSLPRRIARAVSSAGSWAMRPQVAMAAVLVVMVGTSVVLLRSGHSPSARNTKVTEQGTPVATLEPASPPIEPGGAPAVIGGGEGKPRPAKESPKLEAKPTDTPAAEDDGKFAEAEGAKTKAKAPAKDEAQAPNEKSLDGDGLADLAGATGNQAGKKGGGGAPPPPPAAAPMPVGGVTGGLAVPADKAEAKNDTNTNTNKKSASGPMPAPTTASPNQQANNAASYDDAMTAYKASKWAEAAKGFDAAAASGTKVSSSLLYSARSYRASGSCAQALPRYQKLVNGYPSSGEAPHGAIEGGQCAKALSDVATARALFEKAKTYPVVQKQAEAELAALDHPPQTSPPAKAKAAKPSSAVDSSY